MATKKRSTRAAKKALHSGEIATLIIPWPMFVRALEEALAEKFSGPQIKVVEVSQEPIGAEGELIVKVRQENPDEDDE